jgi:hypothetical protein
MPTHHGRRRPYEAAARLRKLHARALAGVPPVLTKTDLRALDALVRFALDKPKGGK